MNSTQSHAKAASDSRLVITRVISAPCAMVFDAWTDPRQMAQWMSPESIECRNVSVDLKVGGAYRIHMASAKGDHVAHGVYTKIVSNELLQFTWLREDNEAMPETIVTVEFEDRGKTTRLTLIHEGFARKADADDHADGWTSTVEKFVRLIEQNKIEGSAVDQGSPKPR